MSKVILYIAQSTDGFIATLNGGVSWLDDFNQTGEDLGYEAFIQRIDVNIQGSKTYEQVLSFDIPYPYGGTSFVLTSKKDLEKPKGADVRFFSGDLVNLVDQAKKIAQKDIWLIGGAQVVQQFLKENLIDEMILFTMPVLLGEGISLFGANGNQTKLLVQDSQIYPSGICMCHYTFDSK